MSPTVFRAQELPNFGEVKIDEIAKRATLVQELGGGHVNPYFQEYLHTIQTRWREATHPSFTDESKDEDISSYESLQSIIRALLGVSLGRDRHGFPTLFDERISEASLSAGQIALLKWAIVLNAQGASLNDVIVTIDKPENHLHPEAMIHAISKIIDTDTDGQVWIATHSVPLIAAVTSRYPDDTSLYFVNDGGVKFAGRQPEKILLSLMGGEPNLEALRQFIDLPELFAANLFAAQCLLKPGVVAGGSSADPQIAVTQAAVFQGAKNGKRHKALDFGAGHGRLLDGLGESTEKLGDLLDYVAWDITPELRAPCRDAITRVYGNAEDRWFNDRNKLFGRHPHGSFDAVVMCNVLHEIDPRDWLDLFGSEGVICRALGDSGSLIVVEDYVMPKGEYAHPYGFIVLDTEALLVLFGARNAEIQVHERKKGTLTESRLTLCRAIYFRMCRARVAGKLYSSRHKMRRTKLKS